MFDFLLLLVAFGVFVGIFMWNNSDSQLKWFAKIFWYARFIMLPQFSKLQRFIIRWKSRSLGPDIDAVITVLSVLIYMSKSDKDHIDTQLAITKHILYDRLKLGSLAGFVLERVIVEVGEFIEDESKYIRARERAFADIVQNIQLYGFALDMLEGEENASKLEMLHSIIQKSYDEAYSLKKESKRILQAQESRFLH